MSLKGKWEQLRGGINARPEEALIHQGCHSNSLNIHIVQILKKIESKFQAKKIDI